ncbi:MAG: hypothetical protein KGK11_12270 [Sphingomonadales bacterium]|nr:hypothetical protein [Sphingomonadales bacterium]
MRRLPTTDIYLVNACAGAIAPRWRTARARPLRALSANAFTCGDWLVLVRRDSPAVMRRALAWPGRLAYLVDDDIAAGMDDPTIAAPYRQRLAAFWRDFHRALLRRADALVVPSAVLAARFATDPAITAAIHRIEPCWLEHFAEPGHFAALADGAPLRLAHLGSASHRGALDRLAPVLRRLLDRHARLELTYVAAAPAPPALTGAPRVRREPPRLWPAYRRWLVGQRFHLGLYPLLATAFDGARSANKLHEHAIVGAVGVYPQGWAPGEALARAEAAILAPAAIGDWEATIEEAIADRARLGAIAARARETLSAAQPRAKQQQLWGKILGTELSGNLLTR